MAFQKDFINMTVRNMIVNKIAMVRHQNGIPDAVKVWRFRDKDMSLLWRFRKYKDYVATSGKEIFSDIRNDTFVEDPIFSVSGDLVFNKEWDNNGMRISNTEVEPPLGGDQHGDNTAGLGCCLSIIDLSCNDNYKHEVSIVNTLYNASSGKAWIVIGTDHGAATTYKEDTRFSGVSYAIFVSRFASVLLLSELQTTIITPGMKILSVLRVTI